MPEIALDDSLKPVTLSRPNRDVFMNTVPGEEWLNIEVPGQRWPKRVLKQRDVFQSTIPLDAAAWHKGYFGYLEYAYNGHHGVALGPTHVWYTILAEVAGHIKANAEHYRTLFTDSTGKKEITVHGNAENGIDPRDFLTQLRGMVPVGVDLFLPEFSTADAGYDVASAAAFCDAVSPYYNYSMMMCGIPRVRIDGTVQDWDNLLGHLDAVAGRMDLASKWFNTIRPHVQKMRAAAAGEVDTKFWNDIYSVERCGSGGQVQVHGWFKSFTMTQPSPAYPENFPSHVSKMEVTQVETGQKYQFSTGILHSTIEGEYLVPGFSYMIERKALGVEAAVAPNLSL